jgi:hypothetical protein
VIVGHATSSQRRHVRSCYIMGAEGPVYATGDTIPGTQAETQAWLDHTGNMTKMMMGDACPLNCGLDMIRVCLRKPHLFAGWSEAEWKALVWMSHTAYRAFMHDASMAPLVQLATDLEARRRPDVRVLPEELQHRAHAIVQAVSEDQGGWKRQGEFQSPPARTNGQFGTRQRIVWRPTSRRCWRWLSPELPRSSRSRYSFRRRATLSESSARSSWASASPRENPHAGGTTFMARAATEIRVGGHMRFELSHRRN